MNEGDFSISESKIFTFFFNSLYVFNQYVYSVRGLLANKGGVRPTSLHVVLPKPSPCEFTTTLKVLSKCFFKSLFIFIYIYLKI